MFFDCVKFKSDRVDRCQHDDIECRSLSLTKKDPWPHSRTQNIVLAVHSDIRRLARALIDGVFLFGQLTKLIFQIRYYQISNTDVRYFYLFLLLTATKRPYIVISYILFYRYNFLCFSNLRFKVSYIT